MANTGLALFNFVFDLIGGTAWPHFMTLVVVYTPFFWTMAAILILIRIKRA